MYSDDTKSASGDAVQAPAGTAAPGAAAVTDPGRDGDASTRERVLQLVVEEGPISAAALGRKLDLTAAAVRRHLDAMTDQGLVEIKNVTSRRSGAGRPSRRYVLSRRGQQVLGDDYLTLVRSALELLETQAAVPEAHSGVSEAPSGPAGIAESEGGRREDSGARSLALQYFSRFEERHRDRILGVEDLDERAEQLAEAFNEDGFAGFTRLVGRDNPLLAMQSTQLCQGHCPIREIATAHPVFCEVETEMIARLLDVDVRRLSTQAAGDHVCTTHVPVGRERLAAERGARHSSDAAVRQVGQSGDQSSETSPAGRKYSGGRRRIVISPRQQERLS